MSISSVRPLTTTRPRPTLASVGQTSWGIDLPLPGAAPTRPSAPATRTTNVAHVRGENLRYAGDKHRWNVEIPYLNADLLDLTPNDPLSIWEIGSYKIKVKSGLVVLKPDQLNQAIADQLVEQGPNFPLKKASLAFQSDNRVKLGGRASVMGLPIPFSVTTQLAVTSPTTVQAKATSLRVFGLPVLWALKLFGVDPASKLPLPAGGLVSVDKRYVANIDLKKTDLFEGELRSIAIDGNQATIKIGAERPASLKGPRTNYNPNYAEVIADGEVALESAILRDASVVILDGTPNDPYSFNFWDEEGYAKVESGQVILDEARLKQKFAMGGEGFVLKKAKLVGADMVVEGSYEFLGFPLPLDFKLNFSVKDGMLKMTPKDVSIIGIGFGKSQLLDKLKAMPGAKPDGDGVLLDLRASASVDMPGIKQLRTEPGRIVLVK